MPRTAARAVIIKEDKMLLSKYMVKGRPKYVTPGGGQDQNETLHECLHREMLEEINVKVEIERLLAVREIIADRHDDTDLKAGFHQVEFLFLCRHVGGEPGLGSEPDECQVGAEWVAFEELPKINLHPVGLREIFPLQDLPDPYVGEMH